MVTNQNRYGNTRKKNLTLTQVGHDHIETYAESHNMTFSAAIETLALIGMEADLSALLIPLIDNSIEKVCQRHFNRLTKMTLLAAAEASLAHDIATMLLLQIVRQEAVQYPQDFEERLPVSFDPEDQLDFRIREIYNQMRRIARKRQKRLMKKPLQELLAQYAQIEATSPKLEVRTTTKAVNDESD
jgi:hypothetical protein